MAHTADGDLREHLCGFFDTTSGAKVTCHYKEQAAPWSSSCDLKLKLSKLLMKQRARKKILVSHEVHATGSQIHSRLWLSTLLFTLEKQIAQPYSGNLLDGRNPDITTMKLELHNIICHLPRLPCSKRASKLLYSRSMLPSGGGFQLQKHLFEPGP